MILHSSTLALPDPPFSSFLVYTRSPYPYYNSPYTPYMLCTRVLQQCTRVQSLSTDPVIFHFHSFSVLTLHHTILCILISSSFPPVPSFLIPTCCLFIHQHTTHNLYSPTPFLYSSIPSFPIYLTCSPHTLCTGVLHSSTRVHS